MTLLSFSLLRPMSSEAIANENVASAVTSAAVSSIPQIPMVQVQLNGC